MKFRKNKTIINKAICCFLILISAICLKVYLQNDFYNNTLFAETEKQTISTRSEFSLALSNKQSQIFVDDIDFGDDLVSIEINYNVEIVGKSEKSIFKNAHFQIVGGSSNEDIISVRFKNIAFDGSFKCENLDINQDKSFNDMFSDEPLKNMRAIVFSGAVNLNIENCDFSSYIASCGPTIFSHSTSSVAYSSKINITKCSFTNNICEAGTIWIVAPSTEVDLKECSFYDNYAKRCVGLNLSQVKGTLNNISIKNNHYVKFSSQTKNNIYSNIYGGGISLTLCNNLSIKNSIIKDCSTTNGGGIAVTNSSVRIENCKILNNTALVCEDVAYNSNFPYLQGGFGGGIFILIKETQNVKIINCNISSNSANNGSSLCVMPLSLSENGGVVSIYFCNFGLNNSNDNNCFNYYPLEANNVGQIILKGCFIVDNTTLDETDSLSNFNYVATKEKALEDKVISQEIIDTITENGIKFLKGSKADILVPVNEYKTWDSTFENCKKK